MEYREAQDIFEDAVRGMVVNRLADPATRQYGRRIYYFCADVCKDKFEAEPEKYISKRPKKPPAH